MLGLRQAANVRQQAVAEGGAAPPPGEQQTASSLGPRTINIQIPAGVVPGQQLKIEPDGPGGPAVMIQVPAGVGPGQVIAVQIPAPSVYDGDRAGAEAEVNRLRAEGKDAVLAIGERTPCPPSCAVLHD